MVAQAIEEGLGFRKQLIVVRGELLGGRKRHVKPSIAQGKVDSINDPSVLASRHYHHD